MRFWRVGVAGKGRLILKWLCEHPQKLLERGIVVICDSGCNDCLDAMIARNEGRIDGAHRRLPFGRRLRLLGETLLPACGPFVKSRRFEEKLAHRFTGPAVRRFAQSACERSLE